ncbi:hypothetical protein Q8F55_004505 [Vanrija albida]|uniref:Uncharacterized protein n=1 Tax=Vanrija albida TaxID=181172 RepID=A0ABR3Q7K1_9TREE
MLVSTWDAYTAVQRPGERDGQAPGPSSPAQQLGNPAPTLGHGDTGGLAIPDPMDLLSPPLATYVYDPASFSPFLAFSPSNSGTPMTLPLVTPAPVPPPPPLPKAIPKLGVLQLNSTFPRPPGDVGNPASWPMPTVIRVVEEAKTETVLTGIWGSELVDAFVREGEKMVAEEGVVAFVTSCGFLATMHPALSARLPFIGTSALLQVAWLQMSFFPGPDSYRSVGIITLKRSALTERHLKSVGAHPATPIVGLPESSNPADAIFKAVLDEKIPYDFAGMQREVVAAARTLMREFPTLRAIVLECTNMPPFTRAVAEATGCRVWDILTLGKWLYCAAVPPDFSLQSTIATGGALMGGGLGATEGAAAFTSPPQPSTSAATNRGGISGIVGVEEWLEWKKAHAPGGAGLQHNQAQAQLQRQSTSPASTTSPAGASSSGQGLNSVEGGFGSGVNFGL